MTPQPFAIANNDDVDAVASARQFTADRPIFLTVEQFSQRNPAFSPPAVRNLVFKAEPRHSSRGCVPGNGLIEAGAIVRLGRRVLIDEGKFLAWVASSAGARK